MSPVSAIAAPRLVDISTGNHCVAVIQSLLDCANAKCTRSRRCETYVARASEKAPRPPLKVFPINGRFCQLSVWVADEVSLMFLIRPLVVSPMSFRDVFCLVCWRENINLRPQLNRSCLCRCRYRCCCGGCCCGRPGKFLLYGGGHLVRDCAGGAHEAGPEAAQRKHHDDGQSPYRR